LKTEGKIQDLQRGGAGKWEYRPQSGNRKAIDGSPFSMKILFCFLYFSIGVDSREFAAKIGIAANTGNCYIDCSIRPLNLQIQFKRTHRE